MALIKRKILNNGISGEYWKITTIHINKTKMQVICSLELFVDNSFSHFSPIPGLTKVYQINVTKEELVGDITALCYTHIKTKISNDSDIQGAIDA